MFVNTAPIFVHVAFGIAFLAQALLLERCVFRMRAERYLFLHPGEILPRTMRREMLTTGSASRNDVLALAPWNRPPVPTYAAALAETGVRGTGDVEDGLIAQQPPPAYGKTRGSVMLLSGFMSDTHRQQVRLARTVSTTSGVSQVSDRPVSYMSHDSAWDERLDVRRAQQLEDTLARLEESGHRSRSPSQDSTRTVMPTRPPPAQRLSFLSSALAPFLTSIVIQYLRLVMIVYHGPLMHDCILPLYVCTSSVAISYLSGLPLSSRMKSISCLFSRVVMIDEGRVASAILIQSKKCPLMFQCNYERQTSTWVSLPCICWETYDRMSS
jgi:hypothetical protein